MSGAAYADLGYMVCNEAGQPYHPDTLSKMWTKAVAAACLAYVCTTLGIPAAPRCIWRASRQR